MAYFVINSKEIGARIRDIRNRRNKTQSYFADMIYISPSYLALIESGKRIPTLDVLVHIAQFCDVSLDYLVFGDDPDMDPELITFLRLKDQYPASQISTALQLAEYYLKLINSNINEKNDDSEQKN